MSTYRFHTTFNISEYINIALTDVQDRISALCAEINSITRNYNEIPLVNEYNLIFIGPVGVGKSTLCALLYHILDRTLNPNHDIDVFCYPEFLQINSEKSHEMLTSHLAGNISSYHFQQYILYCWNIIMNDQPLLITQYPLSDIKNSQQMDAYVKTLNDKFTPTYKRINIFERCCDDSVICFSNIWSYRNPDSLSRDELEDLYAIMLSIDNDTNLPNYSEPFGKEMNQQLKILVSTRLCKMVVDILEIIVDDLKNGCMNRFIGLYAPMEVLVERIHSRNRKGESGYSYQTILDFYNHYELLYRRILGQRKTVDCFDDLEELIVKKEGKELISENGYESENEDENE